MATACTTGSLSPQPVPLDRAECARCRMLISTRQGSGQIVSTSGETRFYDDVACLAADWLAHADGARAFVSIGDEGWSEAGAASYARAHDARTAMGSGIAAFAAAAQAQAADSSARALTFADVIRLAGGPR
jgi:hypothetical protein